MQRKTKNSSKRCACIRTRATSVLYEHTPLLFFHKTLTADLDQVGILLVENNEELSLIRSSTDNPTVSHGFDDSLAVLVRSAHEKKVEEEQSTGLWMSEMVYWKHNHKRARTHTHTHTRMHSRTQAHKHIFWHTITHTHTHLDSTPVSILVPKQVDYNMCRFSKTASLLVFLL